MILGRSTRSAASDTSRKILPNIQGVWEEVRDSGPDDTNAIVVLPSALCKGLADAPRHVS